MIQPHDHPDFIGGIVWTACELRWINEQFSIKDANLDRLCKDMDNRNLYVENLEREIDKLRKKLENNA